MTEKRFLRIAEVIAKTGLKRATIYKRMKVGKFPNNVDIGGCVAWLSTDIDQWIDDTLQQNKD
ncbi:AlpA family phage regulatory protein [Pasteurellaceae bacterium TAE3-ERU1]|nr:AlpA family phage regulatory protein [Pasteurellaceae bacterium TAE3-ERU1]